MAQGGKPVTGQVPGDSAARTATDITLPTVVTGAYSFAGVVDDQGGLIKLAQDAFPVVVLASLVSPV